jgi:alpha/beta superfamily hydrolase
MCRLGKALISAMLVCHPHPQYGGSMDNNVVDSLCQALVAKSVLAFKFNLRGVGASEGSFTGGAGEMDDIRAAVSYVVALPEVAAARVGLVGYSAGAAWGLEATYADERVKVLAALSPPLTMADFAFLKRCPKPKLLVSGTRDELVPLNLFQKFCRSLPEPREYYAIEGADHSWCGYEDVAAEKVALFTKILK